MHRDYRADCSHSDVMDLPRFFKPFHARKALKLKRSGDDWEWSNVYPVCPVLKRAIGRDSYMRKNTLILNRKFLDQFLRIHMHPECEQLFPISLIRLQFHQLSHWQDYTDFQTSEDFFRVVINCISRHLNQHENILVQDQPGIFYIASLNSSVSETTKLVVDLRSALMDLALPLTAENLIPPVRLSLRSTIFYRHDTVYHWLDCLSLVDGAASYETMQGVVPIQSFS